MHYVDAVLKFDALTHLPREARDTLFLLAVIAWVLLPQYGSLPLWCSSMATVVLGWRAWLAWHSRPLPGRWWLLGVLALAMAGTWFTHRTLLGREPGITLIVVLLALKTLELRAKRDAFVVFFLGFFTMLTNFLASQSLVTAAAMLIGLLGLLTALVNAHMPVGKPPLMQAARTAGTMALLGAPVMAVLFVLFPRVGPLWSMPGDQAGAKTGLSASMKVGAMARLVLDDGIAMRIQFEGEPPLAHDLYFRGPVLGGFDGREWKPIQQWQRSAFNLESRPEMRGEPVTYTVTQEVSHRPWLTLLEMSPEAPKLPTFELTRTADMQWLSDRPFSEIVRFKATSYPTHRHGPLQMTPALQAFVDMPPGFNPRTVQWAADLRRDPRYANASTAVWIEAAQERLRTGGYVYTLDPGEYGVHSADEFWFDKKEGFCEHIASSFVILMRALNIPARIVTGYQGGERNAMDGYWVVRQSDAHAWAEVWQAGLGWTRVDPTGAVSPGRIGNAQRLTTPQGVVASALGTLSPDMLNAMRAAWDAVNNRWNQWVLNYGKGQQLDLLKNLGFSSPSWADLGYVIAALISVVSLGAAAWALWERRQHDPWLRLLGQVRHRLEKAGLPLPEHLPPRQMGERVLARFGPTADALNAWLLAMERLRYAPDPPPGQLSILQQQLRTLSWPSA